LRMLPGDVWKWTDARFQGWPQASRWACLAYYLGYLGPRGKDRLEGSDKLKGSMRKEIVKGAIAIGAATIHLLVLMAVGGLADDDEEPGSDIRITD